MIRIVIAEDQELLLGIIGSLLNLEDDMEVVGQSDKGEELAALVEELRPDLCLMDIQMLEQNGLAEALKSFSCKVMVLTTFAEAGDLERVSDADVRGYLLKDSPSEELAGSIRGIMAGKRIYSPELMETSHEGIPEAEEAGVLPAPERFVPDPSVQQNKTVETVKNYLTTFKEKIKIPAG